MASFGIQFGIGLGLQLIGSLLTPPQEVGRLENRSLPDGSYGSRVPLGYGVFPVRGTLVAAPDEYTETRERRGKIGGKVIEFRYSATFGFMLTRNEINTIVQLKMNGEKEIDFLSDSSRILQRSNDYFTNTLTLIPGSETQGFDADLGQFSDPNVAYRGKSLLVFPDLDVTEKFGNRPPLVEAVVSTNATLSSQSVAVMDDVPVIWNVDTTGTANTPIDDEWIATSGIATHSGGLTQEVFASGVLPFEEGNFVEIVFDENAIIGVASNDTAPLTWIARIETSGTLLEFYDGTPGEPYTHSIAGGDGNSLRIVREGNQIAFYINGVLPTNYSVNFSVGDKYLAAQLSDPEEIYARQGADGSQSVQRANLALLNLSDILTDICTEAGLTCDVSEIADQVTGIELRGDSPKDWIEQLQSIYGFFVMDQGLNLKFLNGERPAAVRTFGTLEEFGSIQSRPYTWEQRTLTELPYEVEAVFYSIPEEQETSEYSRLDAQAPSELPPVSSKVEIDTGSTMTPEEAKGVADMTLSRLWMEREKYQLETTIANGDLEPGDTINVPYLGESQEFLIAKIDYGANLLIQMEAYRYDRSPWQLKQTPSIDTLQPPIANFDHPAFLYISQVAKIEDQDPTNPIYWAASQSNPPWGLAALAASADAGASFATVGSTSFGAVIGVTLNDLAAGTSDTVTPGEVLRVRVSGTLSTITQATFDGGNHTNWITIGDEICKYKTATLIAQDTDYYYYTLSDIKRGINGTTAGAKGKHQQFALASTLSVISRDAIGAPAEVIEFRLFLDGSQQSKQPYAYTLV